jgi:hypothetical protein
MSIESTIDSEELLSMLRLESLYDMVQTEIFNLNCSDFNGCEQALIKNHLMAAKLLQLIINQKVNNG